MKPLILKAVLLAFVITTLASGLSAADAAERRQRGTGERTTSWQNNRGTGSSVITGQKTETGWATNRVTSRASDVTGNVNKNYVKTNSGVSATGTYSTSRGTSAIIAQTGVKTENGRAVDTAATFGNGQVVTREVDATHEAGTATRTSTYTGPNGKTKTYVHTRSFNE